MSYTFRYLEAAPEALHEAFTLMCELRPHLQEACVFAEQITRQAQQGYRLLAAVDTTAQAERVVALAGYRTLENLLYGRFIYVDDLVVSPALQRGGLGAELLNLVREEAVRCQCDHLVLDTGLHMPLAQRFYFRQGLLARGMHFTQRLNAGALS